MLRIIPTEFHEDSDGPENLLVTASKLSSQYREKNGIAPTSLLIGTNYLEKLINDLDIKKQLEIKKDEPLSFSSLILLSMTVVPVMNPHMLRVCSSLSDPNFVE